MSWDLVAGICNLATSLLGITKAIDDYNEYEQFRRRMQQDTDTFRQMQNFSNDSIELITKVSNESIPPEAKKKYLDDFQSSYKPWFKKISSIVKDLFTPESSARFDSAVSGLMSQLNKSMTDLIQKQTNRAVNPLNAPLKVRSSKPQLKDEGFEPTTNRPKG